MSALSPARARIPVKLLSKWACLSLFSILLTPLGTAQTSAVQAKIQDHLRRAQSALDGKQTDAAAREFAAVVGLDPKNPDAHAGLGLIKFMQGDCPAATVELKEALAAHPSIPHARALLAICDKRAGKLSAGAELVSSFETLRDEKLRTQVGLELLSLYDAQGDVDRSLPVMHTLVALNPDDPNILYFAQRLYSELADDTLNKLAIVGPDSARMQQAIAEHLVNAGDLSNAIVHYRAAIEIDPRLPGTHFELAEAILESAPSSPAAQTEAGAEIESDIKTNGDSARAECLLARIAILRGQMDDAFARFSRAIALHANNVEAEVGMARLLMMREQPAEALKYLLKAVAADPLNAEAHFRLAAAYRRLHQPDDARQELKLFQEIKKTNQQVRDFYHQMNKPAKPEAGDLVDSEAGDSVVDPK
jgi:tetratricopeptide (TPR) repeat protein